MNIAIGEHKLMEGGKFFVDFERIYLLPSYIKFIFADYNKTNETKLCQKYPFEEMKCRLRLSVSWHPWLKKPNREAFMYIT